jgi:glycosyltransferase involved in cell wall biosynthesis
LGRYAAHFAHTTLSRLKILLTVHQFFPDYAAGTEVLTRSVAKALLLRGHEVHVLTGFPTTQALSDEERFDEYDFEGIHVYRFHHGYVPMAGQTSLIELGYNNHLAARYFGQILQRYQPDLVHFFHLNRLGTGLIDAAVQAGVPAFMTPTDFWAICPTGQLVLGNGKLCTGPSAYAGNCVKHFAQGSQKGLAGTLAGALPTPLVGLLSRLTQAGALPPYPRQIEVKAIAARLPTNVARLNQLAKIVAPNRFMADLLLRHGVAPQRVVQCAFGIDVAGPQAQPKRSFPRQTSQALRVGFIGTLAPHKGCQVLIEAFKALPPGQATLQIYGNPQDFPDYAAGLQQRAHGQQHITFCGVFPNAQIADVLAGLDVLVVPSLWYENTPLVLYSAQAASCPVVASDFPGISEVITHGLNGLLFDAGNVAALARQLRRLLDEPGLPAALSANAQPPKTTATYVDELLAIWAPSYG